MGANTGVSWAHDTFNPWRGCAAKSPGCAHCFAKTLTDRWHPGHRQWHVDGPRPVASPAMWREPARWNREAQRGGGQRRVLASTLCDVFEEDRPDLDAPRARLFHTIEATPALTWMLLTKRIEFVARMVPWGDRWPANVWIGTSVEDQPRALERIEHLCALPAVVRFLSVEPLIGAVDLRGWLADPPWVDGTMWPPSNVRERSFDWAITGGETGPGYREMNIGHLAQVVEDCRAASVPVWVKQDSGPRPGDQGRIPDRFWVQQLPRPVLPVAVA